MWVPGKYKMTLEPGLGEKLLVVLSKMSALEKYIIRDNVQIYIIRTSIIITKIQGKLCFTFYAKINKLMIRYLAYEFGEVKLYLFSSEATLCPSVRLSI